ncbi:hypothetical protein niasHS_015763 [Heterodera schachtii]|uniref:Uncharacterized protein n=1 Tax=Heterodera schachtii TaxID=97005 RepID=A0ABD2HU23_HETSC
MEGKDKKYICTYTFEHVPLVVLTKNGEAACVNYSEIEEEKKKMAKRNAIKGREQNAKIEGTSKMNAIMGIENERNAIMGTEVEQNAIMGNEIEQNAKMGTEIEQNAIIGTDIEQNAIMGTEIEQNAIMGTEIEQNAKMGTEIERNAIMGGTSEKKILSEEEAESNKGKNAKVGEKKKKKGAAQKGIERVKNWVNKRKE